MAAGVVKGAQLAVVAAQDQDLLGSQPECPERQRLGEFAAAADIDPVALPDPGEVGFESRVREIAFAGQRRRRPEQPVGPLPRMLNRAQATLLWRGTRHRALPLVNTAGATVPARSALVDHRR